MRASTLTSVFVLSLVVCTSLWADGTKPPVLPTKALILGVPYVGWSEAAQWRYEQKHIINPSLVASAKMVRRYWGQDRTRFFDFGPEKYMPDHWAEVKDSEGTKGLDDVRAWISRGVPVTVALPLTPHAHPIYTVALSMFTVKGLKLPSRGPSSGYLGQWASWADQVRLTREALGEANKRVYVREVVNSAWRVIIGYDDERRMLIVHDPSFGPAWEIGYQDFESNMPLNDFAYIVRPPHGYADFVAKRNVSASYPERTSEMKAAAHYAHGYAQLEVGRLTDAERELNNGLALPGVSRGYRHLLAYELAHLRNNAGRVEEAIALLGDAIAALPEAPWTYEALGAIYKANPSLPQAEHRAVELERQRANTNNGDAVRTMLRTVPADFHIVVLARYRGWACEPDMQGSRC